MYFPPSGAVSSWDQVSKIKVILKGKRRGAGACCVGGANTRVVHIGGVHHGFHCVI